MCRAVLPPGVEGLLDLAYRAILRVEGMEKRGEVSWASLPAAEQEEVEEAIAMLTEARAQGYTEVNYTLGMMLNNVRQDSDGAEAAFRATIAADPGHAEAHTALAYVSGMRAHQIIKSGGDLAAAAALVDECVELYGREGAPAADHEMARRARAEAARLRRAARCTHCTGATRCIYCTPALEYSAGWH